MKTLDDNILFLFDSFISDDLKLNEQYKNKLINNEINYKISSLNNPYIELLKNYDILTIFIQYLIDILNLKNIEHNNYFDSLINTKVIDLIFNDKTIYNNLIKTNYNDKFLIIDNFLKNKFKGNGF